jgi:pyruvate/2-oxoglutarate dehydrogenase complex dihydrolipoamide dehydrogenase (E3) component
MTWMPEVPRSSLFFSRRPIPDFCTQDMVMMVANDDTAASETGTPRKIAIIGSGVTGLLVAQGLKKVR